MFVIPDPAGSPPRTIRTKARLNVTMNRKLALTLSGVALALTATVAIAGVASAHGPWGGRGGWGLGGADRDAELAQALGIPTDKLVEAQDKLHAEKLAAAVEAGRLTQAQADLMQAGRKLARSIDRDAIMAEALGVTAAELESAREDGTPMTDLLGDSGLTRAELNEKLQAAYDKAVAEAVAQGVITQAQADDLEEAGGMGCGGFGGIGGHGHRGFGGAMMGRGGFGGRWFGRGTMPDAPGGAAPSPDGARFAPRAPVSGGTDL